MRWQCSSCRGLGIFCTAMCSVICLYVAASSNNWCEGGFNLHSNHHQGACTVRKHPIVPL